MGADFRISDAAAHFADLVATGHLLDVALEAPLTVPPRLQTCAHCGAGFFRKPLQRFCSRGCAALARPAQPSQGRRRRAAGSSNDPLILRLLEHSPFERSPDGRWRFGTRAISGKVVDRLIASGRAEIQGDCVLRRRQETAK